MPQGCGCCADPAERSLLLAVGFGCTELSYPEVGLLLCLASPSAWSLAGGKGHWGTAVSLSGQRGWGCCQAEPIQQQCWHWLKPGAPRGATPSASAMGTSVCFWSKGNVTQYSLQHAWQAVSQGHGGEAGGGGGAQHYGSCLSQRGAEHRAPVLPIPKHFALPAVGCGLWARLCCVLLPRPTCGNGHGAASWGGGRGQIPAGGHPAVCPTQHCCTPRGLRGSTAGGVGSFRAHSHPSSLSVFPKAAGIPLWRRSSARPSWELW